MRVSTKVVIDIETGAVVERESYEYDGPVEMARGEDRTDQATAQTMATQQNQQNQQLLAQQQAVAQQIQGLVIPQYMGMLNNPASATPEGEEAASAYGSAQNALAARAARTGNSAGAVEGEDKLAMDKARTLSDITMKNRDTAVSGLNSTLQSLYGTDANLYGRALGVPAEYLNTAVNASKGRPGFWETLGNGFASALGGGLGSGIASGVSTNTGF